MTAAEKPKRTRKSAGKTAAPRAKPVMSVPARIAGLTGRKPGHIAGLAALAGAAAGWLAHLVAHRRGTRR